jgi:two-component system sensor kinase Ihk
MYFITPGYYLRYKERQINSGVVTLTENLRGAEEEADSARIIKEFSEKNNVDVFSFDANEIILPAVSTPFYSISGDFRVVEVQAVEGTGSREYAISIAVNGDSEETRDGGSVNQEIAAIKVDPNIAQDEYAPAPESASMSYSVAGIDNSDETINITAAVGSQLIDHISVTGTLQPIDEAKTVIFSLIPYVSAIAIAVGFALSWIYAKQITKPILRISGAALKMQQMEPGVVSGVRSKDELGGLSENLDVLYDKLLTNMANLKDETDRTARLERSKTDLLHSAGHELKTPIAALNGMIEGMLDNIGAYSDKEKYLQKCKNQVDRLSHLVSEILDASKSDVADAEPELSDTSIDGLVRVAIEEHNYLINERDLHIELALQECRRKTDPDLFYRVLANLVSNAARYTPPGGIIRVAIDGEGDRRQLYVENEFEPISPEEIPKLFEPFYTRSYSRDRSESGTGLGLYIVKRNLERLGIPYKAQLSELGFKISLII